MAEMQEIVLGDLKVRLKLDDSQLEASVKRSKNIADDLDKKFSNVGRNVGIALAAITGAVAAAMGVALKRADDLSKAAQKIGVGTESLSRLEYAGRLADVSLETLTSSISKLNRNMSEVASGGGTQVKQALDALDISVKGIDGSMRSSEEVFQDIADRFSRMDDSATKTALAMDLFGRSGAQMIPLLNEGRDGLKAAADEADRLGITLSTEAGQGAERFNDSLTRLWAGIQGIATRVAVALLPELNKMSAFFESEDFQSAVQTFATRAIQTIGAIAQAIVGITNASADLFNYLNGKFAESGRRVGAGSGLTDSELKQDIAEYRAMLSGGDTLWDRDATEKRLAELERELKAREGLINDHRDGMLGRDKEPLAISVTGGGSTEDEEDFSLGSLGPALGPTEEELAERLETLRTALMSEMELEDSIYKDRQAQLADFLEREMLTKAEYDELWEKSEKEHWERVKEIRQEALSDLEKFNEMSWQDQAKTVFGELQAITEGVKHENEVLFNINKAAAVANAVINTYEGISKSLSAYPMPLAAIMAGVHAAAGFAQVSSILATTSKTSSGSAKGLSGGSGAADGANTSAGTGSNQDVMYVKGLDPSSLFTGSSIRSIVEGLLDYQRNGGQVVLVE